MLKKLVLLCFCFIFLSGICFADLIPVGFTYKDFYIDKTGKEIKPSKEQIEEYNKAHQDYQQIIYTPKGYYSEGLRGKFDTETNNFGFVNEDNEWIIPPKFMEICSEKEFSKGIKHSFSMACHSSSTFTEGLAPIKYDEKVIFYNAGTNNPVNKEIIIPDDFQIIEYENAENVNGRYNVIYSEEQDGKCYLKTHPTEEEKTFLPRGYFVYKYKTGYIDKTGKVVIETKYPCIYPFNDGMAVVCIDYKRCGFINKEGKTIIEPKYSYVDSYANGMARVTKLVPLHQTETASLLSKILTGLFILLTVILIIAKRAENK